jgi:pimeloyl-ACP methyl ester carboxylesterase
MRIHTLALGLTVSAALLGAAPPLAAQSSSSPAPFRVDVSGRGRAVLFIPGFTNGGAVWRDAVATLGGKYQTHVFTLAGFDGQPPLADSVALPVWRAAIIQYIRDKKLERPVIVGHSLGGFLALDIAQTEPTLLSGVVNVDGLPFLPAATVPTATADAVRPMAVQVRAGMQRSDSVQFAAQTRMALAQMLRDTSRLAEVWAMGKRSDRRVSGQAYYEMMTTDLRPSLSRITVPVLNLHAWVAYKQYGQTRAGLEAVLASQYAKLPKKTIAIHDAAYHFIQLDEPAWFHEQLQRFLSDAIR